MALRGISEFGVTLLIAALVGCFNPQINEGKRCGPDNSCPPGLFCSTDQVCRSEQTQSDGSIGSDGPPADGASAPDAAVDAVVRDATPPSDNFITLYAHPPVQGDFGLGGRKVIDDLCANHGLDVVERCMVPNSSFHGFISINAEDNLINMPGNLGVPMELPIKSLSDVVIAEGWMPVFEPVQQPLQVSLAAAGVLMPGSVWWTGSTPDGDSNERNCAEWSAFAVDETSLIGSYGLADSTSINWISDGSLPCLSSIPFLCICYPPDLQ